MNKWITIIICVACISCHETVDKLILDDWIVKTRFYQATYQIIEQEGKIVGRILNYDDGTTQYSWDNEHPKYIFQNLKAKDGKLIDAVSGATTKTDKYQIEIQIKDKDTLHTISSFHNHSISEQWIRKK